MPESISELASRLQKECSPKIEKLGLRLKTRYGGNRESGKKITITVLVPVHRIELSDEIRARIEDCIPKRFPEDTKQYEVSVDYLPDPFP